MLAGTGLPMIDWVRRTEPRSARHVVAVGSCAAWGGVTAGGSNPTDACGLQFDDDRTRWPARRSRFRSVAAACR